MCARHASLKGLVRSRAVIPRTAWRPIMKSPIILLLALLSFSLSCASGGGGTSQQTPAKSSGVSTQEVALDAEPKDGAKTTDAYSVQQQKVGLTEVDNEGSSAEAFQRKIIRNAEITMEVSSTTD